MVKRMRLAYFLIFIKKPRLPLKSNLSQAFTHYFKVWELYSHI